MDRPKGWDKLNEIMCEVDGIDFVNKKVWLGKPAPGNIHFNDVEVLMQVGRRDKNGRDIYRGHIVKKEDLFPGKDGDETKISIGLVCWSESWPMFSS